MMMRAFSLLCLLCMAQAATAAFSDPQASAFSDNINATASMAPPSSTATLMPDSVSDSEEAKKGLESGKDALLGMGIFIIIVMALCMFGGFQGVRGSYYERFISMLGNWHLFLYVVVKSCCREMGTKVVCAVFALLSFFLAIAGLDLANGIYLGVALFFFTITAGLVFNEQQSQGLAFSQIAKLLLILYFFLMVIFFVVAAPAMYLVSGEDGIVILMLLGAALGVKPWYTLLVLYKAEQAAESGGGESYSTVP